MLLDVASLLKIPTRDEIAADLIRQIQRGPSVRSKRVRVEQVDDRGRVHGEPRYIVCDAYED